MSLVGTLCPWWPIPKLFPGCDVVLLSTEAGLFCSANKEPSFGGLTATCTSAHWNEGGRDHHLEHGWSLCQSERAEGWPTQHQLMCSLEVPRGHYSSQRTGQGGHMSPLPLGGLEVKSVKTI